MQDVLQEQRKNLAHMAAVLSQRHNPDQSRPADSNMQATNLGRIASYYCIAYRSLATFNVHPKSTMSHIELLRLFRCNVRRFDGSWHGQLIRIHSWDAHTAR